LLTFLLFAMSEPFGISVRVYAAWNCVVRQ
jgi:hypothetical protein